MRGGRRLHRLLLMAPALALGACAAAPKAPPPVAAPSVPAPAPPPVAAPALPAPSPVDALVAGHREKARALEQEGRLHQALEEWMVALTIKPDDRVATAARQALERRIEREVADRVQRGRDALGRGDQLEARRQFLAALALDPANRTAFDALKQDVKEIRFVNHTVRRGETLASIAEHYYGDRSRSEVIWETNQLPPNPRLATGSVLKIPEIPGVPFVAPELRPKAPAETVATPSPAAPPAPAAPAPVPAPAPAEVSKGEAPREESPPEMNPLLVEAKEALDKGEYQVALADVDKVLAGNAQHPDGVDLKKAILYGLGKTQLTQRRYDASYQALTQLAKLAPNYRDSAALLKQARDQLAQSHYTQGLRFFQAEKLQDAIKEWRIVLDYDPQHANAKRNIDQAERLLRQLQERQQQKP